MSFEIVDYSEKSIAVFGDITKYESHFNELKGMFNANLKYKGESKPGFIFTKFKRPQVQDLVRKLKVIDSTSSVEIDDEKGEKTERKSFAKSDDNVILSREQFMNLVSTLNRLEQDVAYLKKQVLTSGGQGITSNQNNIINMISVPAEKETKSVRTLKKDVKKEVKKEESSDEDYSNDFDEGDVEFYMPQTKGPSLLKKTVKKEEVVEKELPKKGPSLLKRG